MLGRNKSSFKGKIVAVSGSGNVAQYAIEKATQFGAKVVSASDSDGSIYDPTGITKEKLAFLMELKNVKRGRIEEYAKKFKGSKYVKGARVWDVVAKCDVALPCATQNELDLNNAKALIKKGVKYVASGRIKEPPQEAPLPVRTPVNSFAKRLYWPNMYPISRPPTPMSPAGTSVSGPMWRNSSLIRLWQKRITSPSLLPLGSKSLPPLPPPMGRVVRLFLNVCSNPRNFKMLRFTLGWKRKPPL